MNRWLRRAPEGGSNDQGNAVDARRSRLREQFWLVVLALDLMLAASFLASCGMFAGTNDETYTAGTNDETHTTVARILMPDGTSPAVGARVVLVPVDGTEIADSGVVDEKGHPVLGTPTDGVYAMTATLGIYASWTDSVKVVEGRLKLASDDTLEKAGSIAGIVLVQPQHDARTVVVNVLGTDAWANVGSNGSFVLPLLGSGTLRLKFSTTLPDYTPLYQTVRLAPGQAYVFPDTLRLPYTGIPVVQGLKARNDSATGDILLSWNAANHANLVDYVVYRDSAGAVEYSAKPYAATTSTAWRDTTASDPLRTRTWRYRVAVRVSGNAVPGAWYEVVQATSVPARLANLNAILWTDLGAPGGSQVGFLGSTIATARLETGTDSVRLPVWSRTDASSWTVSGTSFALRRLGQPIVRAAGFGAGRLWSFGRSGIGDGIEVSHSADGKTWTAKTIPDSLWPGDADLAVIGSAHRIALVAPGTRSTVLYGDTSGAWSRVAITGRVLGIDDSGIWTDAGLARIARVDGATGRTTQVDFGTWSGEAPRAIVEWKGVLLLQAGSRLWAREGSSWNPRASSPVNVLSSDGDRLIVRDSLGNLWRGL